MAEVLIALGGGAGIAAILTALAMILRQTKELLPDHGGSVKDKVNKTETAVAGNSETLGSLNERFTEFATATHEWRDQTSRTQDAVMQLQMETRDTINRIDGDVHEIKTDVKQLQARTQKIEDDVKRLDVDVQDDRRSLGRAWERIELLGDKIDALAPCFDCVETLKK